MKTKNKFFISIIAIMLSCVIMFTTLSVNTNTNRASVASASAAVRTVDISRASLDAQSVLNEFDSVELKTEGTLTTFTGYQQLDVELLNELDLIALAEIYDTSSKRICYKSSYDIENGIVTLTAVMEDSLNKDDCEAIIDTMEGVLFLDENGNFDAVFDCEGESILLSDMIDADLVEECGFFSNLWSKVKKVWNHTAGKIGTIVTVAACAVVGVVCAVVPGGQLVTAVCIGAAVGLVGGAATAMVSTYLQDGAIDWDAVVCYAGVGAVVGGATAAASFKITSYFMHASKMKSLLKAADKNPTSKTTYIGKYKANSPQSYEAIAKSNGGNYFNLDNYDELLKQYGDKAMEEVNKNFISTKFKAGNDIIATTNPYDATGAFANEIKWLTDMGAKGWEKIGQNLWKLIR